MDRLAEIARPTPTSRTEGNDFTRSKSTRDDRLERRDEIESRADERVKERERTERSNEKPERFSLHLEEQKASLEPQIVAGEQPETDPRAECAVECDKVATEAKADPKQAKTTANQPETPVQEAELAPRLEGTPLELPASGRGDVRPESPTAETPSTPPILLPAVLPVITSAVQPTVAPTPSEIQPAVATAPRTDSEKQKLEVNTGAAKPGTIHAESPVTPAQSPSTKPEVATPVAQVETPRETPAARSAHEVERAADILRQVRVQITPQLSEARIQLHPIELGRISIHITVENDRVKTVVRAEKQEALQAIQTHLPELRAALRQHGIDAQEFQLSLGFENRAPRDNDKALTPSNARNSAAEPSAIEHSLSLRAAVAKTGVDFYA